MGSKWSPAAVAAQGPAPGAPAERGWTLLSYAVALLALGFLCWRVTLPNNERRAFDFRGTTSDAPEWFFMRTANGYDDVVAIVTAHNFARDGFLRTHLLPNRRGAPLVSFFDFTSTQCESPAPRPPLLAYRGVFGAWMPMVSVGDDCVYTHYPPLADWVFGAMAAAGLDRVLHYKLLAVALNVLFLLCVHAWLRREVRAPAALLALLLTATLPAFLQWADAIYYQCFQYLFFVGGAVAWRAALRERSRAAAALTWLLFFCEALVSYELTLAFGVLVAGLALLETPGASWRRRAAAVARQATAPLAAFALHFALRVSFLGWAETWGNATATARLRATFGLVSWGPAQLAGRVGEKLLPLELATLAVLLVLATRAIARQDVRRPLAWLAILLLAGVSFWLAFPGMTFLHQWTMYRHLLPFTVLLLAYLADALLAAWEAAARPGAVATRALALACLVGAATTLGLVAWRNLQDLRQDVAWNVDMNRQHDPDNLAARFLDVVYWKETGTPDWDERAHMVVDGRRASAPLHPSTALSLASDGVVHLELWWLEEVALRRLRLLVAEGEVGALRDGCRLRLFDGRAFVDPPPGTAVALQPFAPGPRERAAPGHLWVAHALPEALRTRALRLTCQPGVGVTLHELEAFGR